MSEMRRTRTGARGWAATAAAGLIASGLVAAGVGAQPAAGASEPVCRAAIYGVAGNGKLLVRHIRNQRVTKEFSSDPLGFKVEHLAWYDAKELSDGGYAYWTAFGASGRPRDIRLRFKDGSTHLGIKVVRKYKRGFSARAVAPSGRYHIYGVRKGKLYQWTRYRTSGGGRFIGTPKLVAKGMAGLKTLRLYGSYTIGGEPADVLYGTTGAGALKQFQIPWDKPGDAKIITVATKKFGSYTGMSLTSCGGKGRYAGLVMIDRKHNVARLYTVRQSLNPKRKDLDFRGVVGKGEYWRLRGVS